MTASEHWTYAGEPVSVDTPGGLVTLVEGSAFCLSGRTADIEPGTPHGLFFADTRVLSVWRLRIDDRRPHPLTVFTPAPFHATFLGRATLDHGSGDHLLVRRDRYVASGMSEDVVLRNLGTRAVTCRLELSVGADFADVFAVKEARASGPEVALVVDGDRLRMSGPSGRGVLVEAVGMSPRDGRFEHTITLPPRSQWAVTLRAIPVVDGREVSPEHAAPVRRLDAWRAGSPVVRSSYAPLETALSRSAEDLGGLRIIDPEHPDETAVAAGAPWFMALFGRDSLLTSWMSLMIDQELATGTLRALARLQGTHVDPVSEEQPGRILHEVRFGTEAHLTLGGGRAYYGSVDATPLFVMLLGELRRWGVGREVVDSLLPHADRAMEWIETYGDKDGDGFVEYERATPSGLANQGWKDSWDGVTFADGTVAQAPIALAEVQGYVYAAMLARAHFAREVGDDGLARYWASRAETLRLRFDEAFWMPDRGYYALALDADKRQVDSLASNMGHCLWTGIVPAERAPAVAAVLTSPEMFTGWGIRTLGSTMGAYDPLSYHNGSVWPHDTALAIAGLMRYGFVPEAHRVTRGLLEAAAVFGGRLPELFSGLDREELAVPVPFPTSCSPQAWAAASPVQILRSILRLDPGIPAGGFWLAPALPPEWGNLRVANVGVAGARLEIDVTDAGATVQGLPPGVRHVAAPRPAVTELFSEADPEA